MRTERLAVALAPAKINVGLEVLGRRADGYHELATTMVALELCDRVEVRLRPLGPGDTGAIDPGAAAVSLELRGPFASADVPTDPRNLAHRAAVLARALAADAGSDLARSGAALELVLVKEVPSQAGLGGASSDAAAALVATLAAFGVALDASLGGRTVGERALDALATLGSDCAFFLAAAATGAASCSGRGEVVSPVAAPDPAWHVALVVPGIGVPTAQVYAALAAERDEPRSASLGGEGIEASRSKSLPRRHFEPRLQASPTLVRASVARTCSFNRLEETAVRTFPELREWRDLFDRQGLDHFRLTGSGATFFGLFERAQEARDTLGDVERAASSRGLAMRAALLTRSSGRGVRLTTSPEITPDSKR